MTATTPTPTPPDAVRRRRLPLNTTLVVGGVLVGLTVLTALVSLVWTPMDPLVTDPVARLQGPSAEHWLGTDGLGRDVASQVLAGARVPLVVGALAVALSMVLGVPIGIAAAMTDQGAGKWIMRWNDIWQAFPALLLAIVLAASLGAGTTSAVVALGVGAAPGVVRVVRAGTLQVLSREFALASRAAGRGPVWMAVRHVLPNIRSILIVQVSVGFALALLSEAALSYLGLGTPAPTPSWGRALQEGQAFLYVQPLLVLWPGAAIAVAVLGFNLLGDGLRDALDPRLEVSR